MNPLRYLRNPWADHRADVAWRKECLAAAAGLREVWAGRDDERAERWLAHADRLERLGHKAEL